MVWSCRALAIIAVATTLAACGHSSAGAGAAAGSQQQSRDAKARKAADLVDPDMVTAVSSAHSTTPINMKFKLAARPAVGTPLILTVALIPAPDVNITRIHVSFQPGDGLQLQADRTLDVSNPDSGTPLEQQLSVVPQQSGVLTLYATAVVDTDDGSLSRSYSMPIIAGDNLSPPHSP